MTTQTTTPETFFHGWFRPNRRTRWTRLADGATYDRCWEELLAATSSVRGGDLLVANRTDDPNGDVGRQRKNRA